MIIKTDAIVLRISPFSQTSHMVTWLTADYGQITTSIKGACRPKSLFLGQYDLFQRCQLLFYRRDFNGVHIAKECSPLDIRSGLRSSWRAIFMASYLCELFRSVSTPNHSQPELYRLLDHMLTSLDKLGPRPEILLKTELQLLQLLGLSPRLSHCLRCSSPLAATLQRINISEGGIICKTCRPYYNKSTAIALSLPIRQHLKRLHSQPLSHPYTINWKQVLGIRRFLGIFLQYHLEFDLTGRQYVWTLLDPASNPIKELTN